MKRYLINGALALIAGIFFASCHDTDFEGAVSGTQKIDAYDQAFKNAFGTPAPNHNWGFSTGVTASSTRSAYAMTRGHDKNSNQWASQGWIIPDKLTDAQKDKVRRYFQQNKNPKGISLNYENFFVQQVYKGGTNTTGSQTSEEYLCGNLSTITGSEHMDKLTAGSNEEHINDFNYGDRGEINVEGKENDAITLMVNSKTDCFGFHNSQDSKQYNDKYVIVPGSVIDAWDNNEPSVTGMFFVGFDYEANKAAYDHNGALSNNGNEYLVTETTANDPKGITLPNNVSSGKYLIGGADGYYSDWIVRITKGVKKTDGSVDTGDKHNDDSGLDQFWRRTTWTAVDNGRVFCEDLGGSYSTVMDDFDFNDIVFDAVIWETQDFFFQEVKIQEVWEEGTPLAGEPKFEQAKDANGDLLYEQKVDENGYPVFKTITVTEDSVIQVKKVDAEGNPMLDENGEEIYESQTVTVTHEVETDVPEYDLDKPIYDEEKPVWKTDENDPSGFAHEPKELTDYRSEPKYQAEIVLLATGATEPATVMGEEVHNAFGVNVKCMVNTVGATAEVHGTYTEKSPFYLGKYNIESSSINDIPIVVLYGKANDNGASTLRAAGDYNGAPQKFQVPMGTPWMQERYGILKGYPAFKKWVTDPSYNWTNSTEEGDQREAFYLYEQTWPNILSTAYYEDKTVIEESQLGETGAPGKNDTSSGTASTPTNMTTKWSEGSDYYSQKLISSSDLSDAGVVGTKGANVVVTGTIGGNWWQTVVYRDWTTIFDANNNNNSQYGQINGDSIVVTIPLSSEDVASILTTVGLRIQYGNITISSIEIKQ